MEKPPFLPRKKTDRVSVSTPDPSQPADKNLSVWSWQLFYFT